MKKGITVLHEGESPAIDIVLIHGFTGDPELTWTLKNAKQCVVGDQRIDPDPKKPGGRASTTSTTCTPTLQSGLSTTKHKRTFDPDTDEASDHEQRSFKMPRLIMGRAWRPQERNSLPTTAPRRDVFWPRDLLPLTVPSSRILTYGYDTKIRHNLGGPVSKINVVDHGWDLLCALEEVRRDNPSRPLLFIAHSLGGLVAKIALMKSRDFEQVKATFLEMYPLDAWGNFHNVFAKFETHRYYCLANIITTIHGYTRIKFQLIQYLLVGGMDVHERNMTGFTPILLAASNNDESLLALVIKHGAKVNEKDRFGRTPLSHAAEHVHEGNMKVLLANCADINSKCKMGHTPLTHAAQEGRNMSAIKLLLENGAKVDWERLFYTAQQGHMESLEFVLEHGAEVNSKDAERQTPLFYAAEKGQIGIVKLLLKHGAEVNSKNSFGRTPLYYAAQKGYKDIVELILGVGGDIDLERGSNLMIISYAAEHGWEDIVQFLLERGAKVSPVDWTNESTPLWQAASNGHEGVVNLLLEAGAGPLSRNWLGAEDSLRKVLLKGHVGVMKLLREHEAKVGSDKDVIDWERVEGLDDSHMNHSCIG